MNTPVIIPTEYDPVILRQLEIQDAPAYFEAVDANREHLSQFGDTTATKYPNLQAVRTSIANPDNPGKLRFGIWDNETFVGSANITPGDDGAEVGYWLDGRFTGHGYATLAAKAISSYAAEQYANVHAEVTEGNESSVRVLERSGFRQTAKEAGHLVFRLHKGSGMARNITDLGGTYQRAFDTFTPTILPAGKREAYQTWLVEHPDYVPSFGDRMSNAVEWARENPESFLTMLADLDTAIKFLNEDTSLVDTALYPNINDYRETRAEAALPLIGIDESQSSVPNKSLTLRAVVDSARRLRLGETTKPEDGEYYSYHKFVKSDEGMVAASLVDLYENYIRTAGLYPNGSKIDAVVANALTEAIFITRPDGDLFQALKNPDDEWIYGYDGFSAEFQQLLYSQADEHK